jgi:acyl carrier protein
MLTVDRRPMGPPDAGLEPRVRRVVCETLGVAPAELDPDASLADDLALDSLDLVELAVALEDEIGARLPERTMRSVRTYGDLVATVTRLAGAATAASERPPWARIAAGDGRRRGLLRAGPLTAYVLETVADEALRGGRGAWVEVALPAGSTDAQVARVASDLARLARRGVDVRVRRDGGLRPRSLGSQFAA